MENVEYNTSKSVQTLTFICGLKCTPNYRDDKSIELQDKEPVG